MKNRIAIYITFALVIILGSVAITSPVQARQKSVNLPGYSVEQSNFASLNHDALKQQSMPEAVEWSLKFLRKFVALILSGLLGIWLFPNLLNQSIEKFKERPWASLGLGSLITTVFPIVILILIGVFAFLVFLFNLATLSQFAVWIALLGGASVFSMALIFGLTLTFLAKILAGLWLGRLIFSLFKKDWVEVDWLCILLGSLLITLLISIPWIGWLISLIIDLFALGTLWFTSVKRKATKS